jgi:hypothetical protein
MNAPSTPNPERHITTIREKVSRFCARMVNGESLQQKTAGLQPKKEPPSGRLRKLTGRRQNRVDVPLDPEDWITVSVARNP